MPTPQTVTEPLKEIHVNQYVTDKITLKTKIYGDNIQFL